MNSTRRTFVLGSVAAMAAQSAPSDRVNMAVVGFHGRGRAHINGFAKIPNVRVAALCDADERLFPEGVELVEKLQGHKPDPYFDIRKLLERKDIDAISIAAPDYWHALMTIWGCQAGKDVYVEKPCTHNLWEGRQLVMAAKRYNRIVQHGTQIRSNPVIREAIQKIHDGYLGEVY